MENMCCPFCGASQMQAESDTDWDSLVTCYYGKCHACGHETHNTYTSVDELRLELEMARLV